MTTTDDRSDVRVLDPDPSDAPTVHNAPKRGRGTLITISTVIALAAAVGLTVLGLGAAATSVTNFDASSWLFSSNKGEVDRVNGVTAKVDTRAKVKDTQNHQVDVIQTDKYLILRDRDTGQVSALDLTTLQVSAVTPTTPGLGVTVALFGESAFVIDSVQGQVRQLDPRTLAPVGDAITLPNGIVAGGFDGKGTLWVGVPSEGTVVAINPTNATPSGPAGSPIVARTVTVTDPDHDLALTALDDGIAVLDNTDAKLITVHGDKATPEAVPITKPAEMPKRSSGDSVPVTVTDDRTVVVVPPTSTTNTTPTPVTITVPGTGPVSPAVMFAGHVYVADSGAGVVYEFDSAGHELNEIKITTSGGTIELEVREDHLFINAPDGSAAKVVDENHVVKDVNKYQQNVPGGDQPKPPAKTDPPAKPVVTKPGRPQNLAASAGNATIRLTWRKARDNGAPITKYVVTGAGQTITVGANQRSVTVKNLQNGKTYTFLVHAVNSVGAGPDATSPAVTPTSDVPASPASVVAVANPDGTVKVTWKAANGLGRKIVRYTVTSVTSGAQAPIGDVKATSVTIAAGTLAYGTQVAFTVVAVNDRGAGSDPSSASNTVIPFTIPDKPASLSAAADPKKKGTIQVDWQPANDNGRAITKYIVSAGGADTEVTGTSASLGGFGDDTAVAVSVAAVNEAGTGPAASATARTIGIPTLTLTSSTSSYTSVGVTFTPNSKGGAAVCKVQLIGAGSAQSACGTAPVTLTVKGVWPNNTYSFTVTVTTAAGAASATGKRATSSLKATVMCGDLTYCGAGIYIYNTPSQANPGNSVGRYYKGNQFVPQCNATSSDTVDATPWGGRKTNQWLRLTYSGATAWFPFAWVNTDGGNNLNLLPDC